MRPANLDELREVVALANELRVAVWTSSRGRNFGYGGPAPVRRGDIALDLRRMDRILEIDEERLYAVVEPGVTTGACLGRSSAGDCTCGRTACPRRWRASSATPRTAALATGPCRSASRRCAVWRSSSPPGCRPTARTSTGRTGTMWSAARSSCRIPEGPTRRRTISSRRSPRRTACLRSPRIPHARTARSS